MEDKTLKFLCEELIQLKENQIKIWEALNKILDAIIIK